MCVIAVAIDKKPSFDQIRKMHDDNSHGCSISWFNEKGLAQYKKGLDEKELFKLTYELPLPFALHFRQSSFSKDKENKLLNHPFEIVKGSPLRLEGEAVKLLIHNGTIREYDLMLAAANIIVDKEEPMTDTRAIAMIMAQNIELLKEDRLPWRIPGYFVIVDSTRKQFRLSGNFTNEDGILFSNLSWKWGKSNYQSAWNRATDDDIYAYMNGEEVPGLSVKEEITNPNNTTQKKSQSVSAEESKKKTQKIKTLGKKKGEKRIFEVIKINNLMTEAQYNSGVYFRPNEPLTSGNQEFMREGMKERRRWWKGVYSEHLYYQQKNTNNIITEYKCCKCSVHLPFFRVNTLRVLGDKPYEFTCISCERLIKNRQTQKEFEILDNFHSKTTRMVGIPRFGFGCGY